MGEEAREGRREFVNDDAANTNNRHSNPSSPDREPSFSPSFDFTGIANKSISFNLDESHNVPMDFSLFDTSTYQAQDSGTQGNAELPPPAVTESPLLAVHGCDVFLCEAEGRGHAAVEVVAACCISALVWM
jgi:hypothetical protein